jgi:transposase-like protein
MARTFIWTPAKERAVEMIQRGGITQARIATQLGTTRRTVEGWARRPAFRKRLEALRAAQMRQWKAEWAAKLAREHAARDAEAEAYHQAFMAELQRRQAAIRR